MSKLENNFKSRSFCLLLYPDCKAHINALNFVRQNYSYAAILHDKDLDDNGELKKPHFHVVIRFSNPRYFSSVVKELNIEPNYIRRCFSFDKALMYLIHFGDVSNE